MHIILPPHEGVDSYGATRGRIYSKHCKLGKSAGADTGGGGQAAAPSEHRAPESATSRLMPANLIQQRHAAAIWFVWNLDRIVQDCAMAPARPEGGAVSAPGQGAAGGASVHAAVVTM